MMQVSRLSLELSTLAGTLMMLGSAACSRVPSPLTPAVGSSIGLPFQGVLAASLSLPPQGPGYALLRRPGRNFGTPAMISAIRFAAEEVDRQLPGSTLAVGDLSARQGGRIPGHKSHRTGRDADLLFYVTTLGGAPIDSPGFRVVGPDGLGQTPGRYGNLFFRFDLARNWLLIKALISAPSSEMLWIFVSRPLEALLIEYALARGEDPVLLWQAECLMLQPKNALPHDDHFHIRVGCSPQDAVAGCEDGGPQWPWREPAPALDGATEEASFNALLDLPTVPPL